MQICRVMQLLEQICIDQENTQMTPDEEKYLIEKGLLRDLTHQIPPDYLALGQIGVTLYHDQLQEEVAILKKLSEEMRAKGHELVGKAGDPIDIPKVQESMDLERKATALCRLYGRLDETRSELAGSFFSPSKRPVRFGRNQYRFEPSADNRKILDHSEIDYDYFEKYGFAIIHAAHEFGIEHAIKAYETFKQAMPKERLPTSTDYIRVHAIAILMAQGIKPQIEYTPASYVNDEYHAERIDMSIEEPYIGVN